ncbi:MAG TPA: PilN domain-containing protein [Candidatus Aquabacterium excrementipullorum]|nr:PilN domain-containing protein [Candidatus Aquabacterium excrementipullorum]
MAVAQDGAVLRALQVTHVTGERPRVAWSYTEDSSDLARGLRTLSRAHPLRGVSLASVLARTQYRLVSTELDELPREEWAGAVRWRLKEQVDFPVDDAIVDVLGVPQDTQNRATQSAIALLEPQSEANKLSLAVDDAGLRWTAIEVPETGLRNICALAETETQAHALIAFGNEHALLVITLGGELVMTRTIEVASAALTGSEEARGGAVGRAGLEVLRTLDTFERTHSKATLSGLSVALPGGAASMAEVLADLVYVPVKPLELGQLIDVSALAAEPDKVEALSSLESLSLLGAALRPASQARGCQQINMQDAEHPQGAAVSWGAMWGLRAAVAVLALGVLVSIAMSVGSKRLDTTATTLEAQLGPLQAVTASMPPPPDLNKLNELRKGEALQRRLSEALDNATANVSQGYSEYLMALGRQAQPNVWVTGLVVQQNGRQLTLSGRMTDPGFLPAYLSRLENEAQFKGRRFNQVEIGSVTSEMAGDQHLTTFSISTEDPAKPATPGAQARKQEAAP